jgi:hypothetical protein
LLNRASANNDDALGAFQAAADAIASGKEAGLACIPMLGNLAVFNSPMTYLLNRTSAMKNTIAFLREHVNDDRAAVISNNIASMSTFQPIVPYVVQLGGIGVLFDYLKRWRENPYATLMAWAGLSDPSHGPAGAKAIADYGGHNKGIEFVMEEIRSYPPHFAKRPDTLTARYESLQIVNGMLEHDESNEYAKAFLKAGLLEQIIHTMEQEFDMRAANSVCCDLLNKLLSHGNGNAIMQDMLNQGVVNLINTAFNTFHDDDTMKWNGETVGYYYRVIPECSNVLANLIQADPGWKNQMLKDGVPQSICNVRSDLQYGVAELKRLF